MKFGYTFLLILAVTAVAVADVFLKQATSNGATLGQAIRSPWMLGAICLYLFQIFFFTYVFVAGVQLVNVGILQTALYATIVLLAGFLLFKEALAPIQIFGALLALSGVILINLK